MVGRERRFGLKRPQASQKGNRTGVSLPQPKFPVMERKGRDLLTHFWLFRRSSEGLSRSRKTVFWFWNSLILLLAGLCLGQLSLIFAYGAYPDVIFWSYFENPLIAVLNILPVEVLLFLLYFLIGRGWIAFLLTSVLTLGLSAANYFKLQFRDDPLMFEDLKYIREAGSITKTADYDLTPDKRVWFAVACVVLGTLFLAFLARGLMRPKVRLPLCLAVLLLSLPLARLYASNTVYHTDTRNIAYINQWSSTQVYLSKGFVYPFLHSATTGSIKAPEGYDEKAAEALLESYEPVDIPEDKKVDLVTIQLEAFADFSLFEGVEGVDFDQAYDLYRQLEAEGYSGNLITNIFAGGTVDTERCFLTGYADLWNFRTDTNSYAWYLNSQGYTVEGSHPSYEWFYNRRNVNAYLGMPTYWFQENYFGALSKDGIAGDAILMPEIYKLYAANRDGEGKPYFSFNVTYQGHGPYDTESVWRGVRFTDGRYSTATTNIVDNYLGSVQDTAEQLQWLLNQFRKEERPVVAVIYGDHKPWLGDGNSAYQELGVNLDTSTEEGFYNYYSTRYLIWANDAAKAALKNDFTGEGPDVSSCFLMNQVFDLCGWTGGAWTQATTDIWRKLPVMTTVGRYQENGEITDTLSDEGKEALHAFQSLEYYYGRHFQY